MTPVIPLADPLPQPGPPLLIWALLQLTFVLHVLAMNVVLGGSIVALHWRFSRRAADALQRSALLALFARALPVAIAATVTLGVAPLLFVQALYGRLFFTSSILMAWLWLGLVPLAIAAYYGAYRLDGLADAPAQRSRALGLGVGLLLAAVAFLQVTNATRSIRPDTFLAAYRADGRGLLLNLSDPSFWPRYLHVLLGAVAVAALAVALVGVARRASDPAFSAWAVRRGTTLFAAATAINLFVGMLFLIALPKELLILLVGGDTRGVAMLAVAILVAVALAGAALLALGARNTIAATHTLTALTVLTLVLMLLLRDELRQLALRQAGFEPSPWVATQWGPLAAFAGCLFTAVAAIAWMVRALARGSAQR